MAFANVIFKSFMCYLLTVFFTFAFFYLFVKHFVTGILKSAV